MSGTANGHSVHFFVLCHCFLNVCNVLVTLLLWRERIVALGSILPLLLLNGFCPLEKEFMWWSIAQILSWISDRWTFCLLPRAEVSNTARSNCVVFRSIWGPLLFSIAKPRFFRTRIHCMLNDRTMNCFYPDVYKLEKTDYSFRHVSRVQIYEYFS